MAIKVGSYKVIRKLPIEDLMAQQSLKTRVKTRELKKQLVIVSNARDALAHGVWINHETTDTPCLQAISGSFPMEENGPSVKARINPIPIVATTKDLAHSLSNIANLTRAIAALKKDVEAHVGPLPDRPQPRSREEAS